MNPVSKRDIPGGFSVKKRKNRTADVSSFLASGDEAWMIDVDEDEFAPSVFSAYYNVIKRHPYFNERCFAIRRKGQVYLVRK